MTAAPYPLGTVAWADIDGVSSFKVMHIGTETGTAWAHTNDETGDVLASGDRLTNIRPLIVLDPDDVRVAGFREWVGHRDGSNWPAAVCMAAAIEEQAKPPRIPEPTGRWAVVEATGGFGRFQAVRWIDIEKRPWLDASGTWLDWDDLVDPVLIRAGIEDGAR